VSVWVFLSCTPRTWPALLALYAQGLPFDGAHVGATAVLAALFGPRAVAIIARFLARKRVTLLPEPLGKSEWVQGSRPAG
jgi:hypothetical protein